MMLIGRLLRGSNFKFNIKNQNAKMNGKMQKCIRLLRVNDKNNGGASPTLPLSEEYRISNKEFRMMKGKTLNPCPGYARIRESDWNKFLDRSR